MATIKPFAALRPKPELASQICELPYDVLSADEARAVASADPLSFFHVSRPEVDLPPDTDPHAPEVYAKGRENFQKLIRDGALKQDAQPCFYLYRQIMGGHSQTGLVAAASCEEYLRGVIKKHELTRVDKENDRVRHIEALNSHTGPAFLAHRSGALLDKFIAEKTAGRPGVDFTAVDGVRHTSWTIADADEIQFIERTFAQIPRLYIADGHHRSAAAARVFQNRRGAGASGHFPAVIFPHDQTQILPYNRVLKDLNGWTPEQLLEMLDVVFVRNPDDLSAPSCRHDVGFYCQGKWRTLVFRKKFTAENAPIENLDVTLLQKNVIAPIFGIDDPRTSDRIQFVGGIRGAAELERLVDSDQFACAFS
ncbi:MAG TPA: DUF1015 domain-containing protein, partial [Candidatus Acidoferrales bacterium]|nr:DUF1015 domain-containing protein [Candidatus Acidoferrales bacterium]